MTPELADAYLKALHVHENSYRSKSGGGIGDYTLSWGEAVDRAGIAKEHRDVVETLLIAGFCDSYEEAMRDASPLMQTRERVRGAQTKRRWG